MRPEFLVTLGLLGLSAASAVVSPESDVTANGNELWKRKGGGGAGGRGSAGGRSGGSPKSGRPASPPRPGQPGFPGSGAPRSFAGGKAYGGGGGRVYPAGQANRGGIVPALAIGGAALAFWPGLWLYGAYMYPYNNHYRFHNDTTDDEEDLPVICACAQYNPCGCEENTSEEYIEDLVGTGAYNQLNHSLVTVAEVNGTKTLLINGTLPNGTEPPVPEENAAGGLPALLTALGYWPMAAAALAAVYVA